MIRSASSGANAAVRGIRSYFDQQSPTRTATSSPMLILTDARLSTCFAVPMTPMRAGSPATAPNQVVKTEQDKAPGDHPAVAWEGRMQTLQALVPVVPLPVLWPSISLQPVPRRQRLRRSRSGQDRQPHDLLSLLQRAACICEGLLVRQQSGPQDQQDDALGRWQGLPPMTGTSSAGSRKRRARRPSACQNTWSCIGHS